MRSVSDLFCAALEELAIENVVDQIRVHFDAGKIETAERRDANITDASCRGADENDLVLECARVEIVFFAASAKEM